VKCEDYRQYFDEYLSHILSPNLHEEIEKHARECTGCGGVLLQCEIIRNRGLIPLSYEKGEAGEEKKDALMQRVREAEQLRKKIERTYVKPGYPGKLTGTRLENYEIYEEIGRGGRGYVYRAKQLSMDRIVALKVLKEEYARDEKFINNFLKEARAAGKLTHLNMITVHHVGAAEGKYFFVMEYVNGETVHEIINREKTIKPVEAVHIAIQVAEALKYAHANGIIHRDVKPDNIMIDTMGIAKLADLGIATSVKEEERKQGRQKKATGTPYYMSPEQVRGESLDFRTDIYSLGATLFHMVTGEVPFKGENTIETMKLRLKNPPPSAHERNPEVPMQLDAIIKKMMARDPEDRYGDYDALIAALKAFKARPQPARPKISSERRKAAVHPPVEGKKTGLVVGLAAGAAVAAVLAFLLLGGGGGKGGIAPALSGSSSPGVEREKEAESGTSTESRPSPPVHRPEPRVPVKSQGEVELEKLLAAVSRSTDYEGNIEKLKAFSAAYPGVKPDLVDRALLDQMTRLARHRITALLEEAKKAIARYDAKEDYGACLRLLDAEYREKFARVKGERTFESLRNYIAGKAEKVYAVCREEAEKLLAARRFEEARAKVREALRVNVPSVTEKVNAYLERVKREERKYLAEKKRREKELLAKRRGTFLRAVDPLLQEKKFEEALRVCGRFGSDPAYAGISALVARKKKECTLLASLPAKAAAGVKRLTGKGWRFKLKSGSYSSKAVVRDMENGMITLEIYGSGGVQFGLKLDKLSYDEILRLSEVGIHGTKNPDDYLALFLGHLLAGRVEYAEKKLAAAERLGLKDADYYKKVLARRKKEHREESARVLATRIKTLLEKGDVDGLSAAVQEMERKYADTECYARSTALLTKAKGEIAYHAKAGKIARYFRGRVETKAGRRISIRYDFSKKEQMEEWCPVLGEWEIGRNGLIGSMGGPAQEKNWMVRTGIVYFLRFSGEIRFSAVIELERNIRGSWESCGLVLGKYRLEIPRFINPKENRGNKAGLTKLVKPGREGLVKTKWHPVTCTGKRSFAVALETKIKDGEPYLTATIDGQAVSVRLADGLPRDAQLGFYSTLASEVKFSNVVISGRLDSDTLDFLANYRRIRSDILARLDAGREIDLCSPHVRPFWVQMGGLWEFKDGMIHGMSRGMMKFDIPLPQYELRVTLLRDPASQEQRYHHSFHLMCGITTKRMLRVGFSRRKGFCGWEAGEALFFNRRYHHRDVGRDKVRLTRPKPIEFRVRYLRNEIICFVDGKKVFSCPNPHPRDNSCAGLMIEWSEYWFKDVKLRKL